MQDWSNKTAAITGGGGKLGRKLAAQLIKHGAKRVVVFDRAGAKLAAPVEVVTGDILSVPALKEAFADCDTVFHLAALVHAGDSSIAPEQYRKVNTHGTECVMEAAASTGVKTVIYASTSHVYGLPETLPVAENHPTRPLSVYAESKLEGEAALRANPSIHTVAARLTNIYGAGIGPETVIGRALMQATFKKPIQLRTLSEIRDFIHIEDAAEALIRLAQSASGFRVVNVSSGEGVLLRDMAETLARIAGTTVASAEEVMPPAMPQFYLDSSLLGKITGWKPAISLEKGLALTLEEMRQTA